MSGLAAVGTVINRAGSEPFRGEQLTATHGPLVGLPRIAFEYQREGERSVVGAPGVALWSNTDQVFRRRAIDARGEATDWLWIRPDLASEAAAEADPSTRDDPRRPFSLASGPATPHDQLVMRALIAASIRGTDPLAIDEATVLLYARLARRCVCQPLGTRRPRRASARTSAAHRDAVNHAIELFAANPARRWTLDEIARRVHTSPLHFCRTFKRLAGSTIREYQLGLRLAAAIELLEDERLSVSDTAARCGFVSGSHLSDALHARTGVRPSRVARVLRSADAMRLRSLMDNPPPGAV